ncbi:MAG: ATP-binding protein [Synergistaceae bacterium]|jgi:hypothetical protein|nr:ATP-binding protein [Synergistaceae bacterium]
METKNRPLKLPIGIQTFEEIRTKGYLYVDKTGYLIDLIDSGKVYFLSRPRRFGKSLTVSTFDALFSGKRELFKGLCAEEFFSRPDYRVRPVVKLDMSQVVTDTTETLRDSMTLLVSRNAERLGVSISDLALKNPSTALGEMLERASRKHGAPAAVLVDEYDKPVLDFVAQPEKAGEVRSIFRNFYTQIKAEDASTYFVFVTGISKFSKMGIFSAMNNLEDISMDSDRSTMLGYTEEELLFYFKEHIDVMGMERDYGADGLVAQIRDYYDGFSFDGKHRVYNPFSTLNFFKKREFRNYWFDSATPSFLVQYVKRHDLEVESFRGREVAEDFTSVAEIENASPESFLFQSGYLTARGRRGGNFVLDYPNMEVLSSVAKLFLDGKFGLAGAGASANNLERALAEGRADELIKIYNSLLASLPYDIYEREERQYAEEWSIKDRTPCRAESFYHALLFALLWSSRIRTNAENHSYWGRSDIEAEKNGYRYVIEMKVADGPKAAAKAAGDAIRQIREKKYADKYAGTGKSVTLIGLAADRTERRVTEYRIETLKLCIT